MAVELTPRIVVIGVGGAGGNAVNNMIDAGLQGVEFMVANTDAQALTRSKAPVQIQLGVGKTSGLGAGANPDVGAESAKESADEIKKILNGAHMCFIAAGMGGGTGTGAAPIIAGSRSQWDSSPAQPGWKPSALTTEPAYPLRVSCRLRCCQCFGCAAGDFVNFAGQIQLNGYSTSTALNIATIANPICVRPTRQPTYTPTGK